VASFEHDTGKPLTFSNYIHTYDIEPARLLDVKSWSNWKNEALGLVAEPEPDYDALKQAAERVAQASGPNYLKAIKTLPESGKKLLGQNDIYANMLHGLLWQNPASKLGMTNRDESFSRLYLNPQSLGDIVEIAEYKLGVTTSLGSSPYPELPLELHAHYGNTEIQSAFGRDVFIGSAQSGPGVLTFKEKKAYALLITLQKSEKDFSPSTMYRDYPLSPKIFHWESQGNTTQDSPTGQNLIHHVKRGFSIHLFVRKTKYAGNKVLPFQYLGKATRIKHEGECPISFEWELDYPMPGELLEG
jgi:hypothetical protein